MNHWVMSFVGDGAEENLAATLGNGAFYVASRSTPIRRAHPGDRVLFYLTRKGFVAEATVAEAATVPTGPVAWSSKKPPEWGIPVREVRPFPAPIPYEFPDDGRNPALGLHRYALTGGFLAIPEPGFGDVLDRAGSPHPEPDIQPPTSETCSEKTVPEAAPEVREDPNREAERSPKAGATPDASNRERREREKRVAGQHAVGEGRKRSALWTVAEMGASVFKLRGAERFAHEKARLAEDTWLVGGEAEEKVGKEMDKLSGHGFYLFHDLPLEGVGNVDHVVLGPRGFFAVETKSHTGTVSSRGKTLLVNGRPPSEGDFVNQAWRGAFRLRDVMGVEEVTPLLCFANARTKGRLIVRGVRVLPLPWLIGEILDSEERHEPRAVKTAVSTLSAATGCHPSAAPHRSNDR